MEITFENIETYYNTDFHGKSSGDTVRILGKATTKDNEQVILLDNRHFVTLKGFNLQYMPKTEYTAMQGIYQAVKDKYISEIKKIGTILSDNEDISYSGVFFRVRERYFEIIAQGSASEFKITIALHIYSNHIERPFDMVGVLRHLRTVDVAYKSKKLHRKNFEKAVGTYTNAKDFANKFFNKFGFLGAI